MIVKRLTGRYCTDFWYGYERRNSMKIPNDPVILLSFINTKLRDDYPDVDELCSSLCINREELESKLAQIGYSYDKENNRFK
jgi:hypothetical protein